MTAKIYKTKFFGELDLGLNGMDKLIFQYLWGYSCDRAYFCCCCCIFVFWHGAGLQASHKSEGGAVLPQLLMRPLHMDLY